MKKALPQCLLATRGSSNGPQGDQVLPLDASDAGGTTPAQGRSSRHEDGDEHTDSGVVVTRVAVVEVVVAGPGEEVGNLLQLPPLALDYLPPEPKWLVKTCDSMD